MAFHFARFIARIMRIERLQPFWQIRHRRKNGMP